MSLLRTLLVLPLTFLTLRLLMKMPLPVYVARASTIVTTVTCALLIAMFAQLTALLLLLCRLVQEGVLSRGTLSAAATHK